MAEVLIIDDDEGMCYTLANMVRQTGHDAISAYTLSDGSKKASSEPFDVIFLDVQMPDGNGLDLLPKLTETPSKPEVIIITGQGNPDGAELAINNGAWDYVEKPSSMKAMMLPFLRALQYREEKRSDGPLAVLNREGIIGNSPKMLTALDLLAKAAPSEANVLITGETGTGKELFAKAVHMNSARCGNNYVVVDCAALPPTLMESTLFGHEKGAFTGADKSTEGLIKHADGGTLLLDEVGELSLSAQKAFLRVLQERKFRPVGSEKEIKSDFRLLASTHRNLEQMVSEGKFRRDLLFRLHSFTIELPPLRGRKEDIKTLAMYQVAKLCAHHTDMIKGFSPDFFEVITQYHWPGNVRELVNTMERALAVSGSEPTLFAKHLPGNIRVSFARALVSDDAPGVQGEKKVTGYARVPASLRDFKKTMEREYFRDLIDYTDGDMKDASNISGISRSNLYTYFKKYKIPIRNPAKPESDC